MVIRKVLDEFATVSHSNSNKSRNTNYGSSVSKKGRELQRSVYRMFQAYRLLTQVWLTRLEQCLNEGQTFWRASGYSCLHDAGKTQPPRKSAAATAAAILCQYIRGQSPTTEASSSRQTLDYDSWVTYVKEISFVAPIPSSRISTETS